MWRWSLPDASSRGGDARRAWDASLFLRTAGAGRQSRQRRPHRSPHRRTESAGWRSRHRTARLAAGPANRTPPVPEIEIPTFRPAGPTRTRGSNQPTSPGASARWGNGRTSRCFPSTGCLTGAIQCTGRCPNRGFRRIDTEVLKFVENRAGHLSHLKTATSHESYRPLARISVRHGRSFSVRSLGA